MSVTLIDGQNVITKKEPIVLDVDPMFKLETHANYERQVGKESTHNG